MRTLLVAITCLGILGGQAPSLQKLAAVRVFGNAGQVGLFVANADGSNEHPLLANPGTDYDAAWAPDGSSIVFTSERDGSAELYRVKPDGSGLERLTNDPGYDDQAAFSPDAKQLVFVTTRGGGHAVLWTLDLATRRAKALTSGNGGDYRPSWSPDGTWIAFSSGRGKSAPFAHGRWERLQLAEIYLVHADGSGLKKISNTGEFCGSPKWTSDSRHVVAYCMTGEQTLANRRTFPEPGNATRLVSIDVTTGTASDLPAGPGVKINPSALPGNEIGYIRKDTAEPGSGIYYTSGKRGPRGDIRTASWSPEGKLVVYHKRLTPALPAIWKTFTPNPRYELSFTGTILPAFSPDGRQFVTNSRAGQGNKGASVMVTNAATKVSRTVYQDPARNVLAPQWSPDGDRIIFSIGEFAAFFDGFNSLFLKPGDRVETGAQVAMVKADGTGYQELTAAGGANNGFPSFSPDGNRFVFRSFASDGSGLRIMNLETKAVSKLTDAYDNFPLWSPRGDLIMFARLIDGAYEIFTIKPDGTSLKRLTTTHGNDAHMTWSPDGEHIAFASSRMGFKDEAAYTDAPQPYGDIFVMRFDGTRIEQITDNQWEEGVPAWQNSSPRSLAGGSSAKARR
ncbi:MAG: hypothetical protein ABI759_07635 [Candidatus Solibacter sp.]